MATYWHIVFFSLLGGLFSLIGAVFLLTRKISTDKLVTFATPFAAGALLAAVFLDLLIEASEQAAIDTVMIAALTGILLFFFAERFLHWFHHHHEHDSKNDPSKTLIIVGDTIHNALDGIVIAAAFLISVPTGIVTTLAVAAHEIPQEIGDFGLLLSRGMRRRKVLFVNICSALATTLLAVITFALGSQNRLPLGVLLGISAGFLLYIALSDVIPEIHESTSTRRLISAQSVMLILGVLVVGIATQLSHKYMHTGHEHSHSDAIEHHDHEGHDHAEHDHLHE